VWGSSDTMYEYMYRAHPQSKRLAYLFADSFTQMGRYESARTVLTSMDTGIGPETHKLLLDCLEHGEVKEHRVEKVLTFGEGQIDGHAITSIDDLAQASLDGKCDVPKASLVDLMDHLLELPAESIQHKQSILTAKAHVLESEGDIEGAVNALRTAYELQTNNSRSLYFSAHTLSKAGRLDEASIVLTEAYEIELASRIQNKGIAKTVYLNIGAMYAAENEFDKALEIYSQGMLLIPTEALFYLRKTELYIQMQHYDGARETLNNLRALDAYDLSEHEYAIRQLGAAIRPASKAPDA
jgi:tetratricopeptide (TPR) repeat protein